MQLFSHAKTVACLTGGLFFSLCFQPALAQPAGIHLSWNGDKSVNTSGTMGVAWLDDAARDGVVRYGTDSTRLDRTAKANVEYVEAMKTNAHKVTLKRLKPSTYYYYQAGSDAHGWSAVYRFRTAPKTGNSGKIAIGVWSDTQDNNGNNNFEQTDSIVQQMSRLPMHFTLHTGDIVENGSVIKSWKGFFNVGQSLNARYPFMSVTGNHDVVNDGNRADFQTPFPVYYQLFNLPNNQLNYSYDYGNTHFVAINSGYAAGAAKKDQVLFQPGSPEYKWLEADLAKARRNKKVQWLVVYCHYPMHAFGVSHVPSWEKNVTPLLDKYEVDLCLSGHRHVYERHKPVRGGAVYEPSSRHQYHKPQGTIYITNGSAGGSLQGVGGGDLPTMVFTPSQKMYTYALMTIEGNRLNYELFNKSGERVDYFTILK